MNTPMLDYRDIRHLHYYKFVASIKKSHSRICEIKTTKGNVLWVHRYPNQPSGVILAKMLKDGTFIAYRPDAVDTRRFVSQIGPIDMWTYGRKIRIGIKRFSKNHYYRNAWYALNKWWVNKSSEAEEIGYDPLGLYYIQQSNSTKYIKFIANSNKVIGVLSTMRRVRKTNTAKPRFTITMEQILREFPLIYKANLVLQDKFVSDLIKISTYDRSWFGIFQVYNSVKSIVDALYPHLCINYPKITKRAISDAYYEACRGRYPHYLKKEYESKFEKLTKEIVKDNPFMVPDEDKW